MQKYYIIFKLPNFLIKIVGMVGLEPTLPFGNDILSVACLPFHHIPFRTPFKTPHGATRPTNDLAEG